MKLQVGGHYLYFDVCGPERAEECLVFLHGFTLDSRVWEDQLQIFSSGHMQGVNPCRVVVVDLIGFGRSSLPADQPFSNYLLLRRLMKALDIGHAHVIGMSMSGGVAIDLALADPAVVDSVVLVGGVCHGQPWSDSWIEEMKSINAIAREEGVDAAKVAWMKHKLFAPFTKESGNGALLQKVVAEYSGWHWLNRDIDQPMQPLAYSRLESLQCPILAITGEMDNIDFKLTAEQIAQRTADGRHIDLPNLGHLPSLEDPQVFNQQLADWLMEMAKRR